MTTVNYPPLTTALVPLANARTLAIQIRRLAGESDGDRRRKLRDLAVKADALAADLAEAVGA